MSPLARTGNFNPRLPEAADGFRLSGWELEVSREVEDFSPPCDMTANFQPVKQNTRIRTDALVRCELWPALKQCLAQSLGQCGPYWLERPGLVISGWAMAQGFRASPCTGQEYGFPAGERPEEWLCVRVEFEGMDPDLFEAGYSSAAYQLSLAEAKPLPEA